MLSDDTLKGIASIFCGDTGNLYSYKSGPVLVKFFNQYFEYNDEYRSGFPSRWYYVYEKLVTFINSGLFEKFLTLILSKEYIIRDTKCTQVEAANKAENILSEFNKILKIDACLITHNSDHYNLVQENMDLVFVGNGGFANVYFQKSTGLIIKKLKDDFLTNEGIRSRFKREYQITKSLSDLQSIIKVFNFDENNCSYTMERAETTLEHYIENYELDDLIKINCIRQILHLFSEVHKRNIVHRDISPNNIFMLSGVLKIADFGLGKDLNMFTSHQTCLTNSLGQFRYCAPEQFMQLKEADKQSDVFSLGRLINFVMTGNPTNYHHMFKNATEKATNQNPSFRYTDANALLAHIEKSIAYHQQAENKERILYKFSSGIYDEEIETYISELTNDKICQMLIANTTGFSNLLLEYMKQDDTHASDVILGIENRFGSECTLFETYDPIAQFAYRILLDNSFQYVVKELAANILKHIAYDINRFSAQRLIEELKNQGIEPLLEEILESSISKNFDF